MTHGFEEVFKIEGVMWNLQIAKINNLADLVQIIVSFQIIFSP
jgi:hypothetical protein